MRELQEDMQDQPGLFSRAAPNPAQALSFSRTNEIIRG
jgi:hypothetical protein